MALSFLSRADAETVDGRFGAHTMKDEKALRQRAREAIRSGRLPNCSPVRVWGGPGFATSCTICGQTMKHDEIGYELEFAGGSAPLQHHVHVRCFVAWELERNPSGPSRREPPGQHLSDSGNRATIGDLERLHYKREPK
jgi:hypothetical protein